MHMHMPLLEITEGLLEITRVYWRLLGSTKGWYCRLLHTECSYFNLLPVSASCIRSCTGSCIPEATCTCMGTVVCVYFAMFGHVRVCCSSPQDFDLSTGLDQLHKEYQSVKTLLDRYTTVDFLETGGV